jgi:hypothetical protein
MPSRNIEIDRDPGLRRRFRWLFLVIQGNILKGAVLVTLLEYGQVKLD